MTMRNHSTLETEDTIGIPFPSEYSSTEIVELRPKTSLVTSRRKRATEIVARAQTVSASGYRRRRFIFKSHPDQDSLRKNEYVVTLKNENQKQTISQPEMTSLQNENVEQKTTKRQEKSQHTETSFIQKIPINDDSLTSSFSDVMNSSDAQNSMEYFQEESDQSMDSIRVPTPWKHQRHNPNECDVTNECSTSQESFGVSDPATPFCCQGQNNTIHVNNEDNCDDFHYEQNGIVRDNTLLSTTIPSPNSTEKLTEFDTIENIDNNTERNTVSRCNYTTISEIVLPIQKEQGDNYNCDSTLAEGRNQLFGSDPDFSEQEESSAYPGSSSSSDNCSNSNSDDENGGFTEIFVISDNLEPIFRKNDGIDSIADDFSKLEIKQHNDDIEAKQTMNDQIVESASEIVVNDVKNIESPELSTLLDKDSDDVTKNTDKSNIDDVIVASANIESVKSPDQDREEDEYFAGKSTLHLGQIDNSSSDSPDLQIPPPSAMKKRGSVSGCSSGKKQHVQFDMDLEVHFVPRDSYNSPAESLPSEFNDYGYENEEDLYSEYSNDVDDDVNTPRDMYNHFDSSQITRMNQNNPSVPFRVIRRQTPTQRQKGRRDSFDLMQVQKLMTQQARERAFYGQKFGPTDHERRYPRSNGQRRGPSPPRTPHSSYYPSREYRRQFDDPKTQMRANAMSPEHFVAFYTRQQQLKQYLDHERRMRRQQLLNGNMKHSEPLRKIERHDTQNTEGRRRNDYGGDDNDVDSETELDELLPRVSTREGERLPQPRPYVKSGSASGRRKAQDDPARISSGYGGSITSSATSSATHKHDVSNNRRTRDDVTTTLPLMTSSQVRTMERQPFTRRQVAEVMRASKTNVTLHGERDRRRHDDDDVRYPSSSEQRKTEQPRTSADSNATFARLSVSARRALQQAHLAYTSSLNDMMPSVKSFPDVGERNTNVGGNANSYRDTSYSSDERGETTSRHYSNEGSQPFIRYLHGHTRGKIPESFTRQQQRDSLPNTRINSGHITSSGSATSSSVNGNTRPTTSENMTVNMLGLSARLPLNARRSAQDRRSHTNTSKSVKTSNKSGDPYRRLTSGNKSPYLMSQLPDNFSKNFQHSLSYNGTDSTKNRPHYNHDTARQKSRHNDTEFYRSNPPQLRQNRYSYSDTQTAKPQVPPKILA